MRRDITGFRSHSSTGVSASSHVCSPRPGERILDVGCGTGRLTRELIKAAGEGSTARVIGLDRSGSMLAVARADATVWEWPIGFVQADGAALPFANAFDAIFSAATLHWIHDHPAVFRSVSTALVPNGRFVAQCGGKGNLQHMLEHAGALMASPRYREHFAGWRGPWNFADAETTAAG